MGGRYSETYKKAVSELDLWDCDQFKGLDEEKKLKEKRKLGKIVTEKNWPREEGVLGSVLTTRFLFIYLYYLWHITSHLSPALD